MRVLATIAAALITMLSVAPACGQGYVCAEGGGTGSGPWAEEMFRWMVEKGNKGSVVLLGAVELEAEDKPDKREAVFAKVGASSVRSLVVTAANADAQETYDAIAGASIVFIRGGSQSRYVEMWRGTKTEKAIHAVFNKGGVIGGTSAGCAVLGEVTYDARKGSLRPEEAVRDARHEDLTLTKDFLGLVPGVLFDTHFGERARLPRLALMLAHCREDLKIEPLGIGLDPRTALCVSPDGTAEVKGEGYATVLEMMLGTRTQLEQGQPPVVTSVLMTMVPAGAKLDLKKREFVTPRYVMREGTGPDQLPALVIGGDGPVGEVVELPTKLPGDRWINLSMSSIRDGVYCAVRAYSNPSETMAGVATCVCDFGSRIILLTEGAEVASEGSVVEFRRQPNKPATSAVVIDTGCVRERLDGPWLRIAYTGRLIGSIYRAKLHLLPPGWSLNLADGVPMPVGAAMKQPSAPNVDPGKVPAIDAQPVR